MKKILSFFIESISWLQLFISPVLIGGLIALFIYIGNQHLGWLSVTILVISFIIGVVFAERVRRKHGSSRFASKILSTPDIWPDEYPEEREAQEKETGKEISGEKGK